MRCLVAITVLVALAGCTEKPNFRDFANDDLDVITAALAYANPYWKEAPTHLGREFDTPYLESFSAGLKLLDQYTKSDSRDNSKVKRNQEEEKLIEEASAEARSTQEWIKKVYSCERSAAKVPHPMTRPIKELAWRPTVRLAPIRKETPEQMMARVTQTGGDVVAHFCPPLYSASRRFAIVAATVSRGDVRTHAVGVLCLLECQKYGWSVVAKNYSVYL